jgi:hypothetical protein
VTGAVLVNQGEIVQFDQQRLFAFKGDLPEAAGHKILGDLALLYQATGDFAKAEALSIQVL